MKREFSRHPQIPPTNQRDTKIFSGNADLAAASHLCPLTCPARIVRVPVRRPRRVPVGAVLGFGRV